MDTDLIEINPLVITKGVRSWRSMGRWHSMTTRFFRHPDVAEMRDETEEDPAELAQGGAQLHQAGWDDRTRLVNGQAWRWRPWTPSSMSG